MCFLQHAVAAAPTRKDRHACSCARAMSSAIWVALGRSDDTALATAIKSASAEELFAADESGTTPLQHAIMAAKYECAKALLGASGALGVPPLELTLWERIQADKLPSKDADGEEVEPKDVEAEEYQTELAAELLADLDPAEAGYLIKAIIKIGYYVGGRATVEEHEMAFDTQVAERRGFGVCMLPGGDVYAGEYSGGLREGSGALKTKAGTAYVGKWLAGKRHGQGSMTYSDGGVYTGWWAYGKRHGQGTFTYPNKDSYVGAFHAGVKHGAGKYTSADTGAIYEGTWKNGSLVASKVRPASAAPQATCCISTCCISNRSRETHTPSHRPLSFCSLILLCSPFPVHPSLLSSLLTSSPLNPTLHPHPHPSPSPFTLHPSPFTLTLHLSPLTLTSHLSPSPLTSPSHLSLTTHSSPYHRHPPAAHLHLRRQHRLLRQVRQGGEAGREVRVRFWQWQHGGRRIRGGAD